MTRNIEEILKNAEFPDFELGTHRQALRRRLLDEVGRKSHVAARRKRIITIAAIALAGLSTLAAAGVALHRIVFKGIEDGVYIFRTEPETIRKSQKVNEDGSITMSSTVTQYAISPGPGETIDVGQKKKDLQGVEALRQQDNRKILRIFDMEYQGQRARTIRYMYTLPDGRTTELGEGVPGRSVPVRMQSMDIKEIVTRSRAGEGELLPPKEEVVNGRTFVFKRRKITLSDGRKVIHSVGAPKMSDSAVASEQPQEGRPDKSQRHSNDTSEGVRELVRVSDTGSEDGIWFRSYTYEYTYPDGSVSHMATNKRDDPYNIEKMKEIDIRQILELRKAGKGELLSPKEEIIEGRRFVLERHRLILSDGQIVVRSIGEPENLQTTTPLTINQEREGFTLHPNVPNPFNPQTSLRYELSEASEVRIVAYSLTGQKVRTLVNQQMPAGSHQVVWDGRDDRGRDAASGTYLIRMQVPQFAQTQKVSLIR